MTPRARRVWWGLIKGGVMRGALTGPERLYGCVATRPRGRAAVVACVFLALTSAIPVQAEEAPKRIVIAGGDIT